MPRAFSRLALAVCACGLLAGCSSSNTAQAPVATTYPYAEQRRMQAAHHWEVLARYEVEQMMGHERLRVLPLYLGEPPYSSESGSFHRGFRDLMTSELVKRGARVSTVPEHAAQIRIRLEAVRHRDRSFIRPPKGAFTTLALGVMVASHAYTHWAEPSLLLLPGALLADAFSGNWTYTGDDEVIITTQVVESQRIVYSSSSLYYINAGDRWQYGVPNVPSRSLLPMMPVTERW